VNRRPHEDALAARWTLEGEIPLGQVAEGSSWHRARAADGESRALFLAEGGAALEVADAARRAFLVENPRLLAVDDIDVFDDHDGTPALTAVSYPFPPAPPLAALLADGPLRAETARSVIGEAATGLEAARRRGLRHQHLDSNRVFVDLASGSVWVLGVGVETAAHGTADPSGPAAAQRDVTALVALLYRAVTGASPRRDETGVVPRAGEVAERRVPEDLEALCDGVLNPGDAPVPANVRELIAELGPWQSIPVTLEAYDAADAGAGHEAAAGAETADEDSGATRSTVDEVVSPQTGLRPASSFPLFAGSASAAGATAAAPEAPKAPEAAADATGLEPEPLPDSEMPGSAPEAPEPTEPEPVEEDLVEAESAGTVDTAPADDEPDRSPAATDEALSEPVAEEHGDGDPVAEASGSDARSAEAQRLVDDLRLTERREQTAFPAALAFTPTAAAEDEDVVLDPDVGDMTGSRGTPEESADVDAAAAAPPAVASTPSAPPSDDRPGEDEPVEPEPDARDDADEPRGPVSVPGGLPHGGSGPIVVPGRETSVAAAALGEDARRSSFRDVMGVAMDRDADESYAVEPEEAPGRSRRSLWILVGAVIVVILALVLALTSITSGLRERMADPFGTAAAASSAAPSPTASAEATSEAPAATQQPAAAPPAIASVAVESSGSGDHADNADRLTDGDPGTVWKSKRYASASFGGLKDGIGIRIDLTDPATVNAVVVTTAQVEGGTLELHAVNDDGSMGDTIASGAFAGDGEVRLAPAQPVQAQHLMVWIPELPSDGSRNLAQIAEIRVE